MRYSHIYIAHQYYLQYLISLILLCWFYSTVPFNMDLFHPKYSSITHSLHVRAGYGSSCVSSKYMFIIIATGSYSITCYIEAYYNENWEHKQFMEGSFVIGPYYNGTWNHEYFVENSFDVPQLFWVIVIGEFRGSEFTLNPIISKPQQNAIKKCGPFY